MKFSEKSLDFKGKDVSSSIITILILTVTAPLRLVIEVSTRLVFTKKKDIIWVLGGASLISLLITIFTNFGHRFRGTYLRLSVLSGIIATLILISLTAVMALKRFSVYDDLDDLQNDLQGDDQANQDYQEAELTDEPVIDELQSSDDQVGTQDLNFDDFDEPDLPDASYDCEEFTDDDDEEYDEEYEETSYEDIINAMKGINEEDMQSDAGLSDIQIF